MKVSWDDYSQYMENKKMFQITNQNMLLAVIIIDIYNQTKMED